MFILVFALVGLLLVWMMDGLWELEAEEFNCFMRLNLFLSSRSADGQPEMLICHFILLKPKNLITMTRPLKPLFSKPSKPNINS